MNVYIPGTVIEVTATFVSGGSAVDPTTVKGYVTEPDGTEHEYTAGVDSELTRTEAGTYVLTIETDVASNPGIWWYGIVGTGNYKGSAQGKFDLETWRF